VVKGVSVANTACTSRIRVVVVRVLCGVAESADGAAACSRSRSTPEEFQVLLTAQASVSATPRSHPTPIEKWVRAGIQDSLFRNLGVNRPGDRADARFQRQPHDELFQGFILPTETVMRAVTFILLVPSIRDGFSGPMGYF